MPKRRAAEIAAEPARISNANSGSSSSDKAVPSFPSSDSESQSILESDSADAESADSPNSGSESEEESGSDAGAPEPKRQSKNHGPQAAEVRAARETSEMFKSNVFKLQVDEVFKEIAVDPKYAAQARKLLFTLRETIAGLEPVGPVSFADAQREINTRIPFPAQKADDEARSRFAFQPPSLENINVIGSWSLHTAVRRPEGTGIDLFVPMAAQLFESKDYLSYRYHRKRAFFVAVLASQLAGHGIPFDVRFTRRHECPDLPILQLIPTGEYAKLGRRIVMYIHVGPEPVPFPFARLQRDRNANRAVEGPTPRYNWTLLSDLCTLPLLRYLHAAAAAAHAFTDAVKLGGLWLRQRRWGSSPSRGGFGTFEFSILVAALLNGGLANGKRRLLTGYSSYQLFKGALLYLAEQPEIALTASIGGRVLPNSEPGIVFADIGVDVLANMPAWAPKMLRHDAHIAVDLLNDSARDRFEALFLRNCSAPELRYDIEFEFTLPQATDPVKAVEEITTVLHKAWGPRYVAMSVSPALEAAETWPLSSDPPTHLADTYRVGAVLDASQAEKRLTFAGDEFSSTDEFKQFWGPKASLRRFQDGSIKEAVVWSHGIRPIAQEAAVYALSRHMDADVLLPQLLERLLPANELNLSFLPLNTSFDKMAQLLQEVKGLPLRISSVYGTSASLRQGSIAIPEPFDPNQMAEAVIHLESSTRWPDDYEAVEKVKMAFLIKLAEIIRKEHPAYYVVVGLEAAPNDPAVESAFATILTPEGFYIKARILEASRGKLSTLADHTRLMTTMCNRYPALSLTIRLTKLWLEKQMLMSHIMEPAAELIALHVFVNSAPWAPPACATTAFWRALDLIARWNWREDFLALDVDRHIDAAEQPIVHGCDMDAGLFTRMAAGFAKQRQQDPAFTQAPWVITTKLDERGVNWTAWDPRSRVAAVIAARVTALARAARPGRPVFKPALSDFDVCWTVRGLDTRQPKNIAVSDPLRTITGAQNVALDLVEALMKLYKDSIILFYSGSLGQHAREHKLCGVWNRSLEPHAKLKANWTHIVKKTERGYELDRDATVAEIERLGGGMLTRD